MALDPQVLKRLEEIRQDTIDILEQIGDFLPDGFLGTIVFRYAGENADIKQWAQENMVFSNDAPDDAIAELQRYKIEMEEDA
jgi:hypothetical protein